MNCVNIGIDGFLLEFLNNFIKEIFYRSKIICRINIGSGSYKLCHA